MDTIPVETLRYQSCHELKIKNLDVTTKIEDVESFFKILPHHVKASFPKKASHPSFHLNMKEQFAPSGDFCL